MTLEKVYAGKTKDVYRQPNGNLLFSFKDDVTGEDGVVDPGANSVMGQIKGKGKMSLEMSQHFFNLLQQEGIPTHFIAADLNEKTMEVKEAQFPGKDLDAPAGLEFICRCKAYGSFTRRYQNFVKEKLQNLHYLVEITLKDDERGDPLINDDALLALGVLNREQLEKAKEITRRATQIIENELLQKGLYLVDIKLEFGISNESDKEVIIIDEVSGDSMRVMDKEGNVLSHEELYRCLFTQ